MNPPRVLVVDDEPSMVELIRTYLERDGLEVLEAGDGPTAVDLARRHLPSVIVLDINLPGFDGLEVLRSVRTFSDAYVLLLTARGDEIDRVLGLSLGADDYVVKPFSPRELVARIRALLRRSRLDGPSGRSDFDAFTELAVDPRRHEVRLRGIPVSLTPTEFQLLATMARDPGVVFSRELLLDRVWGPDWVGDEHVVDVHVASLRRKLGDPAAEGQFIETVRGVGYRLRDRSREPEQ